MNQPPAIQYDRAFLGELADERAGVLPQESAEQYHLDPAGARQLRRHVEGVGDDLEAAPLLDVAGYLLRGRPGVDDDRLAVGDDGKPQPIGS